MLETAKALAERVEAEATRAQVPVGVGVIDTHDNPVLHYRMNGAPAFSREISERKTFIPAHVGMLTAELVQSGQPLFSLLDVI